MRLFDKRLACKLANIQSTFGAVYFITLIIRAICQIILLLNYSALKNGLKDEVISSSSGYIAFQEQKIRETLNWLLFLGSAFRELKIVAVFGYIEHIVMTMVFFFFPLIYGNRMQKYVEHDSCTFFLTQPKLSRERTRKRINQSINKTIVSNFNFLRRNALAQQTNARKSPGTTMSSYDQMVMTEGAKRQHKHLMELINDEESLWPPNRNEEWRQKLRQDGIRLYFLLSVVTWLVIHLAFVVAIESAYRLIKVSPIPYSRELTVRDRVLNVENLIFLLFATHWFAESVTILLTIIRDQLYFLKKLRLDFDKLLYRVAVANKCIEDIEEGNSCSISIKGGNEYFQLDDPFIDLYLSYSLFNLELKSSLNFSSVILSQYLVFVMVPTVFLLSITKTINLDQWTTVFVCGVVKFVGGNVISLAHAKMNAQCLKLTNKYWSLVARISDKSLMVTRHTSILWWRVNEDCQQLQRRYTCKVFGENIDHQNIIRLDLWLVSVALLFLGR